MHYFTNATVEKIVKYSNVQMQIKLALHIVISLISTHAVGKWAHKYSFCV